MSKSLIENIDSNPVAINAYQYLWRSGLIYPGAVIPKEAVEAALEMPYENTWAFLGKYLALQLKLKAEGFFVNQKKLDAPSFRIVKSEDMAEVGTKRIMSTITHNFETAYIMAAHDISKLDEHQKKKHKSVQQKAASVALVQQKLLLDNTYF